MIICKRPDPPNDHLQEARSSRWSFARGQIPRMIFCNRPDPPVDHLQDQQQQQRVTDTEFINMVIISLAGILFKTTPGMKNNWLSRSFGSCSWFHLIFRFLQIVQKMYVMFNWKRLKLFMDYPFQRDFILFLTCDLCCIFWFKSCSIIQPEKTCELEKTCKLEKTCELKNLYILIKSCSIIQPEKEYPIGKGITSNYFNPSGTLPNCDSRQPIL